MSINLDISHLRAIVGVGALGSFTAAATALGVGQPSLSRTVADAERRLNLSLFTRTTRRVELTGDGRAVSEYARAILLSFDEGMRDIEGFLTGDRGSVSVACLPSIAATFLPPHIVAFRQAHPDVSVAVRDGLLEESLAEVRAGVADIAIVAASGRFAGLYQEPIGQDSFYCAVPRTHRLAGASAVAWSDLAGEPFIAFGADSSIEGPVRQALEESDVELGTVMRARNVGAVAGLVAAGLGITAVPELVLPMMGFADLAYVPLIPRVHRRISIVYLATRRQTTSARHFIELLRRARG